MLFSCSISRNRSKYFTRITRKINRGNSSFGRNHFSIRRGNSGGTHAAEKMAKIFNGAKPKEISLLFEDSQRISFNMRTAIKIGFMPAEEMLEITDEMYSEILVPEKEKEKK